MDDLFNHEAARWARDVVMKMSDAEARAFVTAVVHDTLHWDIEANRRTLNNHIVEVNKSLLEDLSRVVSKSAGAATEVAEALVVEVSKAFGSDPYTRDERGRFSTVESRVRTSATQRPMKKTEERRQGIPSAKAVARASGSKGKRKLSPSERAAYQQQYLQLAETMDRFTSQGARNAQMVLEDKSTGRRRTVEIKDPERPIGWDPARHNLVAVRAESPTGSTLHDASFDLVSALGGTERMGNRLAGATTGVAAGGSAFADRWTDASRDNQGTNDRTYRRIQAGSELLGQVAPNSPKAQVASKFGEFVGEYGPEAEKVIGPRMRKTAYRYRGTERKPDVSLIRSHSYELRQAGIDAEGQEPEKAAALGQKAASNYLLGRLPSRRLAEIQRQSGKIPPSEGIIINSNGKIVTQAVGYAEDHYLPFNLKNLKGLKGGHYVRSRSMGGLTTEDIYTGLVSGARSVTVVSNSGIFTVHFEDDFRGGRRHNDKAAGMVDRYAKTLDAIKEGQIERDKLDPDTRAAIRAEVEAEYEGFPRAEVEDAVEQAIKDFKSSPHLTEKELAYIDARAKHNAKDDKDYQRARNTMIEQAMEERRSRFYKLDGEGYAAAAEALKEQYPYYIANVNFAHRREMLAEGQRTDKGAPPNELQQRFRDGSDSGYVKARHNRPDEVMEGFFDPEIAGEGEIVRDGRRTGKTKASHTNYQNWEHNPTRRQRGGSSAESEGVSRQSTQGTPRRQEIRQEAARVKVERESKQLAQEAVTAINSQVNLGEGFPALTAASQDFDANWSDLTKRTAVLKDLEAAQLRLASGDDADKALAADLKNKLAAIRVSSGRLGNKPFNRDEHLGQPSDEPYVFPEAPYQLGADFKTHEAETRRQTRQAEAVIGTKVEQMSDPELTTAAAAAGRMANMLKSGSVDIPGLIQVASDLGAPDVERWAASREGKLVGQEVQAVQAQAKQWAAAAEALERLRRLKAVQPEVPSTARVTATRDEGEGVLKMARGEAENQLRQMGRLHPDKIIGADLTKIAEDIKAGNDGDALERARSLNDDFAENGLKAIFNKFDPFND